MLVARSNRRSSNTIVYTSIAIASQDDVTAIFDLRVPHRWMRDPSGAEISWLSPTLGKWFSGMRLRVEQLCNWLEKGRPKSFWLAGFFNPTGFLTGMMQEVGSYVFSTDCCRSSITYAQTYKTPMSLRATAQVTRQHKKDQWGLDDVVLHSEMRTVDVEKIKDIPDEGVNIHGLYIEGSR